MSPHNPTHFKKGDRVEVRDATTTTRSTTHNSKNPMWFPATVLRPSPPDKVYVVLETLLPDGENTRKHLKEYVEMGRVRPLPPLELHRCYKVGDGVEVYREKGWVKGEVRNILVNSKYLVGFSSNSSEGSGVEEEEVVELWRMRAHREWVDGCWFPPFLESKETPGSLEVTSNPLKLGIKHGGGTSEAEFREGTVVEVKSDEIGYEGSWFPATIIKPLRNNKFLVEYQTLKTNHESEILLKEEADGSCIRPPPPWIERVDRFEQLEEVDVWYNDGWWVGNIAKALEESKYVVYFNSTKEEMVFEHSKLRPHQEWIDCRWVTTSTGKSLDLKPKQLKLKIKYSRKTSEAGFSNGTIVEVRSNEEGYQGSWYTAVVVGSAGNDKFLVEYKTLKTDDESEQLREKADASYIRPCPPEIQRIDRFKMLEEVDAWYNDGWWVGLISKVLTGLKYGVYFWTTNEELEFDHFKLRPHQEWINGKWVASFLKRSKLPVNVKTRKGKPKRQHDGLISELNLIGGIKVEIGSDEEGNLGSWYPAVIIRPVRKGKFLVQYQTLKTDDGLEPLIEEVDAPSIRPSPVINQRVDRFKPLDEVDVWYNNGWWSGQVCKVLEGSSYSIYIRSTNEVLEFQHANLRPHQDWIDGKWIVAIRGRTL